jgi:hypothetical protein
MKSVSHASAKRKSGGPVVYSPEIAAEICRRVSSGETLREVCRTPGMPSEATVRGWHLRDIEGFSSQYVRAREAQIESWSDEIVAISNERDSEPNDRRVRIDTKRWLMSKIVPKKYGDRVVHAGDPDDPVRHLVGVVNLETLSNAELDALERFCQARLAATAVLDQEEDGSP